MLCGETIELFQKIHVVLPKPVDYMKKQKMLLTDKVIKWFMENHKSKLLTIRRSRLKKESQNK